MSQASYTLIAYKPDSSDYCRGCHMASYSSDHKIHVGLSAEELANKIAECASYETQCNEERYKITVIGTLNGVSAVIHDENWIERGSNSNYDEIDTPEYQAMEAEFQTIKKNEQDARAKIVQGRKVAQSNGRQRMPKTRANGKLRMSGRNLSV